MPELCVQQPINKARIGAIWDGLGGKEWKLNKEIMQNINM